jgi:type IV secretion system protein VirD4
VPLDRWTADMGGRGVSIIAAFQSRAQMIDRYGEAKTAVTLTNTGAKVLFGGTGDRDDLTYWSTLAGERDEPITTTDLHGRVASRTVRKVAVLSAAQIAGLPEGKVVVFRRGMSPVIGRVQMAYRRPDVRALNTPDALRVKARAALHTTLARVYAATALATSTRLTRFGTVALTHARTTGKHLRTAGGHLRGAGGHLRGVGARVLPARWTGRDAPPAEAPVVVSEPLTRGGVLAGGCGAEQVRPDPSLTGTGAESGRWN